MIKISKNNTPTIDDMFLQIIECFYMAFSETKTFLVLEEDSVCLDFSVLGHLEDTMGGLVIMKKIQRSIA